MKGHFEFNRIEIESNPIGSSNFCIEPFWLEQFWAQAMLAQAIFCSSHLGSSIVWLKPFGLRLVWVKPFRLKLAWAPGPPPCSLKACLETNV